MTDPRISIVLPVYNEIENLAELVEEVRMAFKGRMTYELLLVDDASTDGSPERAQELARDDVSIRILRHTRNLGQSASLYNGFRSARGRWVATLDADGQNDPADLPRMLPLLEDFDCVAGVRSRRRDGWYRQFVSRMAALIRDRVTGITVRDTGCGTKVFRKQILERLPAFDGMHRFLPILVVWAGGSFAEMDVHHRPRRSGVTKYTTLGRALHGAIDLIGVRWLLSRRLPAPIRYRGAQGERWYACLSERDYSFAADGKAVGLRKPSES
jgi:dolichol-phosphate mannosyltransferase